MSPETPAKEDCYGFIQLVHFCNVGGREEAVRIGGAGFLTKRELEDAWSAVPEASGETDFMADLMDAQGDIVGDKWVSGETCAALMGKPLPELIAGGIAETAIDRAAIMARLQAV
jgi:hypothetical protein